MTFPMRRMKLFWLAGAAVFVTPRALWACSPVYPPLKQDFTVRNLVLGFLTCLVLVAMWSAFTRGRLAKAIGMIAGFAVVAGWLVWQRRDDGCTTFAGQVAIFLIVTYVPWAAIEIASAAWALTSATSAEAEARRGFR